MATDTIEVAGAAWSVSAPNSMRRKIIESASAGGRLSLPGCVRFRRVDGGPVTKADTGRAFAEWLVSLLNRASAN